jgi:hypothetical protein
MAGLTGRPGAQPGKNQPGKNQPGKNQAGGNQAGGNQAGGNQPDRDPIATVYRRSQLALGASFAMLVGAVIAFALHSRVVGIVLLVLMLLCGMGSFFLSVVFRNRAVAAARSARQEQAARTTVSRKSSRPKSQLPFERS